jgi:hypothetical protein
MTLLSQYALTAFTPNNVTYHNWLDRTSSSYLVSSALKSQYRRLAVLSDEFHHFSQSPKAIIGVVPRIRRRQSHPHSLRLTFIRQLSIKCRSFDDSQPYGLPLPVTCKALPNNPMNRRSIF